MKRKFIYNPDTCQYEPVFLTGRAFIKKLSTFLLISTGIAAGIFLWYIKSFSPIQEQYLQQVNYSYKLKWETLEQRIEKAYANLDELIYQDDTNYRVILDLPTLSKDVREAGVGGAEPVYLKEVKKFDLIAATYKKVEKLNHQIDVEKQSYNELTQVADTKINMWSSRPAIQPISNKELDRLHTTYGTRFHPIHHRMQAHKGLDFSAPRGTPVYATGDGRVSMGYYSESYGNVVYVDHGFDFETRYAHLNKFIVHQGEFVKRGQIVGYVGNTGISASPHLHYEVLYKGSHTNPINFFQRDLSNAEYEKLLRMSSDTKASLD
jgi:murein DD-endopeptidase MepM/ murein hydrolase activator NlpD